jgi:hypothetical protein
MSDSESTSDVSTSNAVVTFCDICHAEIRSEDKFGGIPGHSLTGRWGQSMELVHYELCGTCFRRLVQAAETLRKIANAS